MKKKTLGIFSVLVMSLLAVSMVFAYQGDPNVKGPEYSEEKHEAMQAAFEGLNYEAWSALMIETGRGPKILTVITEDNFEDFVAAKQSAIDGDFDPLNEFKASLGLGVGQMKHGNGEALGKYQGQGAGQGEGLGKGQKNFYKGSK